MQHLILLGSLLYLLSHQRTLAVRVFCFFSSFTEISKQVHERMPCNFLSSIDFRLVLVRVIFSQMLVSSSFSCFPPSREGGEFS
ncbi:hypothetical protein VIGAN_07034200 [Vigna angularis var. angularis]|uniref:Secreted protein n=1 Tax=Vigna angularis var. angularis TaxID=157739 RepID=A0A0S3SFX7_PHAAN|nr:hypothetical protein VIGAN_07034200 [Vigna angularis var. angularis]